MKEFKLIRVAYVIVIGVFSISVGLFMSSLIQTGGYTPVPSSCDDVEFTTLACVLDDTVYFTFRSGYESPPFTLRINDNYVGEISQGLSAKYELTPISDTYSAVPEVEASYVCPNKIQTISHSQISQC